MGSPVHTQRTGRPSWLFRRISGSEGKRESQWGSVQSGARQACLWEGQTLALIAQHFVSSLADSPLGCAREITVAGIIKGEIIPVVNTPPTVGGVGVSSPLHGLFCFRFSFPQSAGGLSVTHRM